MNNAAIGDWANAIMRAETHAPFLARALLRQPELRELLSAGDITAALQWAGHCGAHDDIGIALRRERLAIATAIGIADLAGVYSLTQVVEALSNFADRALDTALCAAIAARTGDGTAAGMIALALGKQGAGELNYSSDIDPILLYQPDRLNRRQSDDPGDAAQRYARQIVKLLSENTAEGYVLRVDLRLRPASEISPMAVPYEAALAHYQSAALAWERAAFTRARAAAGDIAAGKHFLETIRPFIWRSALDFGAIEEIRDLTRRIRDAYDGPTVPGPGFDVKRGRGGIREIEFFAQTHQLIHGGRDPSLRVKGTRAALDALAVAGRIDTEQAQVLGNGYDRLRTVEHRLQMVHDRQTHTLPQGTALDNVAQLDGLADANALVTELTELTGRTGAIYEELIGKPEPVQVSVPASSELADQLRALGFHDPDALAARIKSWRDGRYQSLRSDQAITAFERVQQPLLKALAQSDDPDRAIIRWEGILEKAPSAITLFRLLHARPHLLDRLVAALTLTPMLSDELARRPELLDTLLDQSALELPGSVEDIAARMEAAAARPDYEAMLDAIRVVTGEIRFTLGVQIIEGQFAETRSIEGTPDPLEIAKALARTAEAGLQLAAKHTRSEFAKTYGHIPGEELLVLGLGRLGGGVLTHASDLDIIYLFTGDFAAQSDGARPLSATHYFNRLASRVSAALSVPTAQGALYEVDTRLRPQGAQGPLAVSLEAFAKYQNEAAWTWEHMALTRARVLVGSDKARSALSKIIENVVRKARNEIELRNTITSMRGEIAKHKQSGGPLDVKLVRGGLVDLEFIVHFLQLRGGQALAEMHPNAFDPDLATAVDGLIAAGLLPEPVRAAHGFMTRLLVAGRLLAPSTEKPPAAAAKALAKAVGAEDYDALLQKLNEARQGVKEVWNTILRQSI